MKKTKLIFQGIDGTFVNSKDFQSTRYLRINEENRKNLPVLYEHKDECCGCTACYAACPKTGNKVEISVNGILLETTGAISMLPDEEGFLYPVVDAEMCVKCKKCMSICVFKKR